MSNTYQKPNAQVMTFKDNVGHDIIMIGVKQGRSTDSKEGHSTYLTQLTRLFNEVNIGIKKKFIETFSNGTVIYTIYTDKSNSQEEIQELTKLANVVFNIPESVL